MKKIVMLTLVLSLSLSLIGCDKKEEVKNEILDEDKVVLTDEAGNEYVYSQEIVDDIQTGFEILNEYTSKELNLYSDKENYL